MGSSCIVGLPAMGKIHRTLRIPAVIAELMVRICHSDYCLNVGDENYLIQMRYGNGAFGKQWNAVNFTIWRGGAQWLVLSLDGL